MQNKQAIFIIGSPGSGKDVVIRDICSNYNIVEFTSTQIDEMLSNDAAFKRAKFEKQYSLLENLSILVTANSYDLGFVLTKQVLEAVGYSTHLILVEANMSTSYERLRNRTNLRESLDRISSGNSNKNSIKELFPSQLTVDNSQNLDLSECRKFVFNVLEDLTFNSDLTLESIKKPVLKKVLKSKIVPPEVADTRGSMGGVWSLSPGFTSEALDYPMTTTSPIATGPLQQIKHNSIDYRSDQDKAKTKKLFNKIKKIKRMVVPNGIE